MRLIFLLTMLVSHAAYGAAKLQDADFKTVTQLINGGGSAAQLLNDSKIYVTANGINQQLSSAISSGLIGGGGVTSLVSNGTFEASGVSGWSTFQTTLSNLVPSTAPATCSSCTFAIGAQTSGALDGATSLQLTGASTTTAGQGFISSAFTVAPAFQGQPMTIRGVFAVTSGLAALKLNGDSTNSFAIYIYDVTNAQWIQPAGTYGLASNGGPFAPISFQIPSNTTSMRLAIVNVNALAAATTLLFDDLVVTPAAQANGLAGTDEVVVTPVVTNATAGTVTKPTTMTYDKMTWSRVGDKMHIHFLEGWSSASGGATPNGCALIQIPGGYQIDMNKAQLANGSTGGLVNTVGTARLQDSANNAVGNVSVYSSTQLQLVGKFNANGASATGVTDLCWNQSFGYTDTSTPVTVTFDAWVPIAGWSTNVTQSSDYDGRLIVARFGFSATQAQNANAANAIIPFNVSEVDTAGAGVNNSQFKVPAPGLYEFTFSGIANTSTGGSVFLWKNGATLQKILTWSNDNWYRSGTATYQANVGDVFDFRADATTGWYNDAKFIAKRIAGSSPVIQASQSINATYGLTASQSVAANSVIKYDTRIRDPFSGFSTSTGQFTVPVSGTYRASVVAQTSSAASALNVRRNGATPGLGFIVGASTSVYSGTLSFYANAGDQIGIYAESAATFNATNNGGGGYLNQVTFERTGN